MLAGIRRLLEDADRVLTRPVRAPRLLAREPEPGMVTVELAHERRSTAPIDRLSRRVDTACRRAIDVHEIAASLEAEGLNDRIAQEHYSHPDVFSLAAEIRQRVPQRPAPPEPRRSTSTPRVPPAAALVMRGPLYLIPILFFFASRSIADHTQLAWIALPAVAFAWVWNQGSGVLVHRFIGRANLPAAHRLARWSLASATALIGVAAWLAGALALDDPWLGWYAAGQTAYLVGSAALITLAHDRILALALAPGATVMITAIASGSVPDRLVSAAAVFTVGAVVAAVLWVTQDARTARLTAPSPWERSLAATHALLGASWAAFIAAAGYAVATASDVFTIVSIAAAPMVVTMGVAEWRLHRFRRDVRRALAGTAEPAAFAERSRAAFTSGLVVFGAAIAGAATLAAVVAASFGLLDLGLAVLTVAFVLLGCACYAGLALAAMERADVALIVSVGALLATICMITMARLRVVGGATADLTGAIVYLAGCLAAAGALVLLAHHYAAHTVNHR
jgi:hypothetical protein